VWLTLVLESFALKSSNEVVVVHWKRERQRPITAATVRSCNFGVRRIVGVEIKMNVGIFFHA
jgi:hypothetical protein